MNVNIIIGRNTRSDNVSSLIDPDFINEYFQKINTDTQNTAPVLLSIPERTRIPKVDLGTVEEFMTKLKQTAPEPDGLPYWLWKDLAKSRQSTLYRYSLKY
jgi:hypothetical protein